MENTVEGKRRRRRAIAVGIGVRLLGVVLIYLGDGHTSLWSKALVVVGVVISVTGIGILRYLLLSPRLSKMSTEIRHSYL